MDLVVWDIENRNLRVLKHRLETSSCEAFMLLTAWPKPSLPDVGDLAGLHQFRHTRVLAGPDAADMALIEAAFTAVKERPFNRIIIVSGDKIFWRLQSRLASNGLVVVWDDVELPPGSPQAPPVEPMPAPPPIEMPLTYTPDMSAAADIKSTLNMIRQNPIAALVSAIENGTKQEASLIRVAVVMNGLDDLTGSPISAYVENARGCNLLAGTSFGRSDSDRLAHLVSKTFRISANAEQPLSDDSAKKVIVAAANIVNAKSIMDAEQLRTFGSLPRSSLDKCSLLLQKLGELNLLRRRASDRAFAPARAPVTAPPDILTKVDLSLKELEPVPPT